MTPPIYKVTEIRSKQGIYKSAPPADVIDEGGFYRVAGTYIFDKFKIKSMELKEDKLTLHLIDEDVVLTVIKKK